MFILKHSMPSSGNTSQTAQQLAELEKVVKNTDHHFPWAEQHRSNICSCFD